MTTSPRPSLRVLQRENTRRGILSTARTLFRTHGIESVSMEDIARGAAMGRATVYLHFSGKPILLKALLEEDWDRQAILFERLGTGGQLDQRTVKVWLERVVEGMRKAQDSFAIHRAALGQDPSLAPMHEQHRERLAGILLAMLGPEAGSGGCEIEREVNALMIVAEIEYLATMAISAWNAERTKAGIALLSNRIMAFAGLEP